ncbi:MAG: tyrosine-type recombinase/integrase [Gemmatimonadetes bacterium]|nr:tyrosine-type recombinase/integrase [Gemmatimonadota bacterium]
MAWKRGRVYWAYLRQPGGRRKRISLGTTVHSVAREAETMLARLAALREWPILLAAQTRPDGIGELLDAWRSEGEPLERHRALISDADLNTFVDGWISWAERRAGKATVAKYRSQLRVLIPSGVPFPRSRFRRRDLSAALQQLATSGSTRRRYHAAWSSFANYLVEIEVIEHNPLRDIRAPRPNPGRTQFLDQADQRRLVEAQPSPYAALAALREAAGVEISAALRVRRRDIWETEKVVFVLGSKNEWRARTVIVEDWAWPILRRVFADKLPDAFVFDGLTYEGARKAHRDALAATGLNPEYRMHDARHSIAVRWMKQGVEPQIIASNLGHRDASLVLKLYGRYQPRAEDLRRVRERGAV